MFELLEAAANFAGMLVSMDRTLFHFDSSRGHDTDNAYKAIRWAGFHLETMAKWEDTPLGKLEREYVL